MLTRLLPICLLSATSMAQEVSSHASLHPAGAALYMEMSDMDGLRKAWPTTALGQLVSDEALLAAIRKAAGDESLDPMAMMQELMPSQMVFFMRAMESELSGFSVSMRGEATAPELLLVMEFSAPEQAKAMAAMLQEGMSSAGQADELMEGEEGGVAVLFNEMPGTGRVSVTAKEELMRIRVGDGGLFPDAPGDSMAAAVSAIDGSLPAAEGRVVMRAVGDSPTPIWGAMAESAGVFDLGGSLGLMADGMESAFGPVVSMLVRGGHWRMTVKDGLWITDGFVPPSEPASRFGTGEIESIHLSRLHPDAALAWVSRTEPDWTEEVFRLMFEDEWDGMISEIEAEHGLRIDSALRECLGDSIAVSVPPMRSVMTLPTVFAETGVSDASKLQEVLGVLGKVWETDGGSTKISEYRGTPIHAFAPPQTGMSGGGMNPLAGMMGPPTWSVVVFSDHALITNSASYAKREVRRRLALDGESELPALLQGVEIPAGAGELVAADWMGFIGKLYDALRGAAPMLAQTMGGGLPIDVESLPESSVVTRFFGPTLRYESSSEGGRLYHETSSFGPEIVMAGLLAAGWSTPAASYSTEDDYLFEDELLEEVDEHEHEHGDHDHSHGEDHSDGDGREPGDR